MGKQKRKLSRAEKAAKKKQRQEYETIFINGKMKRVRRPTTIEGMSVDDFIRRNAGPIFLHQEELWEYLEPRNDVYSHRQDTIVEKPSGRAPVSFITINDDDDLTVAYAISIGESGEVVSLILQRTKYEFLLPPEEQGVVVSHELFPEEDRDLAHRILVDGSDVDIESTARSYLLDLSAVAREEMAAARKALERMHRHGGFQLVLR
jgi:hypothetical protein